MGREQESLERYRIEQLEKRISQLDQFSSVAQSLRTSLMDSLAEAKDSSALPPDEKDKHRALPRRER